MFEFPATASQWGSGNAWVYWEMTRPSGLGPLGGKDCVIWTYLSACVCHTEAFLGGVGQLERADVGGREGDRQGRSALLLQATSPCGLATIFRLQAPPEG